MENLNDEYCACHFCHFYTLTENCTEICWGYMNFSPDKIRIVEKAKEKGISVVDVLALMKMKEKGLQ